MYFGQMHCTAQITMHETILVYTKTISAGCVYTHKSVKKLHKVQNPKYFYNLPNEPHFSEVVKVNYLPSYSEEIKTLGCVLCFCPLFWLLTMITGQIA